MKALNRTQSICPICHKPVDAYYGEENKQIFFYQECPEHGTFRTLASESAEDYKQWIMHPVINIPPKAPMTKGDPNDQGCPLYCGTCENHLQTACCVLIDVTQRCNQHCPYCFAQAEGDADGSGEPTLEEIEAKYDLLLKLGEEREFNIQLSGGEPTVRDDLPEIIAMAAGKGFEYIQINSNGRRLAEEEGYAEKLKEAGASVIFMQFDGTNDEIYMKLRGEPLLEKKKQAIRNCEKAGLPVTLVPTITKGVNDDNIGEMMDFLLENVNVVKGIHFQPVSFFGRHPEKTEDGHTGDFPGRITMFGVLRELQKQRPQFAYEDFLPISTGHTLCCFYTTYIREPDGSVRCTLTKKAREEGVSCCDTVSAGETCCCGEPEPAAEETCCCCGEPEPAAEETCCCCGEPEPAAEEECCCCGEPEPAAEETCCCCGEPEPAAEEECCCAGSGVQTVSCCDMTAADQLEVIRKDRDYVLNKWDIDVPDGTEECCCGEPKYKSSEEITDLDEFLTYYRRNTFTVTGMAFQDLMNLDAERVKRCRVQQLTDDDRLVPFCAYNTLYRK